jgi:methionine-gamma-lyase
VYYLGFIEDENNPAKTALYKKQYKSAGAMISFDVKGGEKEAFIFLNSLKLIKLAVSLGSTESLAEHPATMTHVDIDADVRQKLSITDKLVRLSVGVENFKDIIWDVEQALEAI